MIMGDSAQLTPAALSSLHTAPSLETLPAEVLNKIFHQAREPSLIHTSRTFYHNLPPYIDYIRDLSWLAFAPAPRKEWHRIVTTIPTFQLYTGADIETKDIDKEDLQLELSRAHWFTFEIFRAMNGRVFWKIVRDALLSPESGLFENKRTEYAQVAQDQRGLKSYEFNKFGEEIARSTDPTVHFLTLTNPSEFDNRAHEYFNNLDITTVPDCLLRNPLNHKVMIWLEIVQQNLERSGYHAKCSADMMRGAMMKVLCNTFRECQQCKRLIRDASTERGVRSCHEELNRRRLDLLIELNCSLLRPCAITTEMLLAAIDCGQPDLLESLLEHHKAVSLYEDPDRIGHASLVDLLRLELSMETRQKEVYLVIAERISSLPPAQSTIYEAARELGYENLDQLGAARDAVRKIMGSPSGSKKIVADKVESVPSH